MYILLSVGLLVVGILFLIFGARVLFVRGFVEKLRKGDWRPTSNVFSEKDSHFIDKYVRGTEYFLLGLLCAVAAMLFLYLQI